MTEKQLLEIGDFRLLKSMRYTETKRESLFRLATRIEHCSVVLELMDKSADLNSPGAPESTVKKLPTVSQVKRAESVGNVAANSTELTIA